MEGHGEEMMESMMAEFEKLGEKEDFGGVVDGMMRQLLSKELMHEPMKQVCIYVCEVILSIYMQSMCVLLCVCHNIYVYFELCYFIYIYIQSYIVFIYYYFWSCFSKQYREKKNTHTTCCIYKLRERQ